MISGPPSSFWAFLGWLLLVGLPLGLGYKVVFKNAHSTLESISYLESLLTLYFSQYYLVLNRKRLWGSVVTTCKFLFSWFMTVAILYGSVVVTMSYLFGLQIVHPDTLLVFINFLVIGVRFLVFKKGRQRGEVFSWIVSICLFSWLAIGSLSRLYTTVSGTLDGMGLQFVTSFFSTELKVTQPFFHSLPGNPYVMMFSFLVFILAEYACFSKLTPSNCGPWSLCYEIDSSISRIIGVQKIISKASDIVIKASKDNLPIEWVTTTARPEILNLLMASKSKIDIVIINKDQYARVKDTRLPSNIKLRSSDKVFPRGFLLVPDQELLVTSLPVSAMASVEPSIGFHTKDIAVISRFQNILELL